MTSSTSRLHYTLDLTSLLYAIPDHTVIWCTSTAKNTGKKTGNKKDKSNIKHQWHQSASTGSSCRWHILTITWGSSPPLPSDSPQHLTSCASDPSSEQIKLVEHNSIWACNITSIWLWHLPHEARLCHLTPPKYQTSCASDPSSVQIKLVGHTALWLCNITSVWLWHTALWQHYTSAIWLSRDLTSQPATDLNLTVYKKTSLHLIQYD